MTNIEWEKPSPGSWEFDSSHQTHPFGRFMDELHLAPMKQGFAEGFAEAGIPLQTIDGAIINGWYYMCVRPLGGPPEASGPPPAFIMWMLFKLHPELRRRQRRAQAFFAERRWETMNDEWFQKERPKILERIHELLALKPAELDAKALSTAVRQGVDLLKEQHRIHFRGVPAGAVPTGDFLVNTERWSQIAPKRSMAALAGFTNATAEPIAALDLIVEALRQEGKLSLLDGADPEQTIEAVHATCQEASKHLASYQRTYGTRLATDYAMYGRTLNELPGMLVDNLRQRVTPKTGPERARIAANQRAEEIRACIPQEHRTEWEQMLQAARGSMGRREDEGGLMLQVLGIMRGLLLEAGKRLVAEGRAVEPESALDLTESELLELLKGKGPSLDEVAEFTAERKRFAQLTPPSCVGPEGSPPPIEVFPKSMRRMVSAVFAFVSRFSADADPVLESGLAGHGVSPGVVTARARVVRGPEDFERFCPGDILVAQMTSPAFNTLLSAASAVVTETGGLICHAAIVAREFGMPGIVGVQGVMSAVPDGALITVDGDRGTVQIVDAQADSVSAPSAQLRTLEPVVAQRPSRAGDIVGLSEALDSARFGGKAASLATLVNGGLPVPWGIALDTDASQSVAASDPAVCAQLQQRLADRPGPFAVRSSATVEDSASASFAGQFLSVLGVNTAEDVVQAVQEVWESGSSDAVRAYQRRLGIEGAVRMAVVVQELIPAQSAGVLFFDPQSGHHIVEASWGLGETVVDGSVSPDRYEIDATGRLQQLELGDKRVELMKNGQGLKRKAVDPARASTRCLDDVQLSSLAQLGREICAAFGDARDIEWAFSAAGVHCLQARPITVRLPTGPVV